MLRSLRALSKNVNRTARVYILWHWDGNPKYRIYSNWLAYNELRALLSCQKRIETILNKKSPLESMLYGIEIYSGDLKFHLFLLKPKVFFQ